MPDLSRSALGRYGVACAGVALATAVRHALDPVLGDLFPFATLFYAVLVIAWYGGSGPALLATALGAVLSVRFLLPPRGEFALEGFENQAGLVLYLGVGAGIALLGGAMRAARTRAETSMAAVLQQREALRVTLTSIGDAVIATDAFARVTSLNPAAEAFTGWTADEARGQPLETVFRIISAQSREPVESPATRALRDGVVVGLANHTLLIARDGRERPIDDSAAPMRDQDGQVVGVVLVFRDITARQEAELALRNSERLYRAIGESIDYGVWVCAPDGRNLYASESFLRLVGLTQAECSSLGWASVLHPDDVEATIAAWKECVASEGSWDREHRFRGVDGEWHPILARGVAVRDEAGKVVAWAGINLDIGRLKQVEEELRASDRRKDHFLAVLSHELRNPLAPVRNALQVLKGAVAPGSPGKEARDIAERQVHHLTRLVDDLLDVSRIIWDKIALRRERMTLVAIVERALEAARYAVDERGHELTVSLPATPIWLDVDGVRLAQVLANLLRNAARYTPPQGRIWLTAETRGDQAEIRVRDTGQGMDADTLPRVFEMFVQGAAADTEARGGLGIGLSLVKSLVELHGGTVEAHSAGAGAGSEFVVRLPLVSAPTQSANAVNAEEPRVEVSRRRILVVDDNVDAAESLAMLLELEGHDVAIAHSGQAALEAVRTSPPEWMFLDIGMPVMDGHEVARELRADPRFKKIVLVALTGWGQDEDRRRSKEAGFDHHVVKPVEPSVLQKLLGRPPG
jgi:PAS domain S-box-containing protein